MKLKWEDPPDKTRDTKKKRVIEVLKGNAGVFAKVGRYKARSTATTTARVYRSMGCEAVARNGCVYARWPKGKVKKNAASK